MQQNRFRKFRTFQNADDAQLALAVLRQNDVSCEVVGGDLATSLSIYGVSVSKIDLYVLKDDELRAEQILEDYERQKSDRRHDRWGPTRNLGWQCPHCEEVNEQTFEICWSCNAVRPDDPVMLPLDGVTIAGTTDAEPLTSVNGETSSDSPYRVLPGVHSGVGTSLSSEEVALLKRRAVRSFWFGLTCVPLLTVVCLPFLVYSLFLNSRVLSTGQATPAYWVMFWGLVALLIGVPMWLVVA